MSELVHPQREAWRLIVFRENATEMFLLKNGSGFSLPCVEIPKHGRVAMELNKSLKTLWNFDVFSLYPLVGDARANGIRGSSCCVLETIGAAVPAPQPGLWLPVSALPAVPFSETADAAAVKECRKELASASSPDGCLPIGWPGTFDRIKAWVQRVITPSGRKLREEFLQVNAGKGFALIRFETDRDALWFKAVGEPNHREFPVTVALSNLIPQYLPPLLATEPVWNAWLTAEVSGVLLSQFSDLNGWKRAARDLALLQIASSESAAGILERDCRDVRHCALLARIEPFFACLGELMRHQTNPNPSPLSPQELRLLESQMWDAVCSLQGQRIPDTLGHLDLNPDNLIANPERTFFLDWAEASVGHPFLSFAHFLEHFRTRYFGRADGYASLVREYLDVWESQGYIENAEPTVCLALLVAVLAHAVSTDVWRDHNRIDELHLGSYYRSLARRMKSYAERIQNGACRVSEVWA